MKEIKGRNGGTLKKLEKGDAALPGGGRPPGSISLKVLANKILDGTITKEDADGKKMMLTRREAMVLSMIEDAISDEDPTIRLRAGISIWDRIESKPPTDIDVTSNGKEIGQGPLAGLPIEDQAAILRLLSKRDADK